MSVASSIGWVFDGENLDGIPHLLSTNPFAAVLPTNISASTDGTFTFAKKGLWWIFVRHKGAVDADPSWVQLKIGSTAATAPPLVFPTIGSRVTAIKVKINEDNQAVHIYNVSAANAIEIAAMRLGG